MTATAAEFLVMPVGDATLTPASYSPIGKCACVAIIGEYVYLQSQGPFADSPLPATIKRVRLSEWPAAEPQTLFVTANTGQILVSSFAQLGDDLFVGACDEATDGGAGVGDPWGAKYTIYKWDGETLSADDVGADILLPLGADHWGNAHAPMLAIDHNGLLFAGMRKLDSNFPTYCRTRSELGAWTNVALPIACFTCESIVVFDGATYLGGYGDATATDPASTKGYILKWDGAALTVVHGPLAVNARVRTLAVVGGVLYYLVNGKIGKSLDGTTFTDSIKDLVAQIATLGLADLVVSSDKLYVVSTTHTLVSPFPRTVVVYSTPANGDPTGTWVLVAGYGSDPKYGLSNGAGTASNG